MGPNYSLFGSHRGGTISLKTQVCGVIEREGMNVPFVFRVELCGETYTNIKEAHSRGSAPAFIVVN